MRLGGVLRDCLTFVLELLLAGQEVELRANVAPSGPGLLRVETRYRDERGHTTYGRPLERQLEITPGQPPLQVWGEVGVVTVRYKKGTTPPSVRLEEGVKEVRYEAV